MAIKVEMQRYRDPDTERMVERLLEDSRRRSFLNPSVKRGHESLRERSLRKIAKTPSK